MGWGGGWRALGVGGEELNSFYLCAGGFLFIINMHRICTVLFLLLPLLERHLNNVGGGSAFFTPSSFFSPAYAGVKFIDKSTIFFFLAIFCKRKLILGSFLLHCWLIWFALKGDRSDIRISARFPGDAPTFTLISLVTAPSPCPQPQKRSQHSLF